jgi:hypothetical protein
MLAIYSKGISISAAIAFQDADNPNQFFYHPVTVKSILGETLQDFKVSYWGIGRPFFVQRGTCIDSVVGTETKG